MRAKRAHWGKTVITFFFLCLNRPTLGISQEESLKTFAMMFVNIDDLLPAMLTRDASAAPIASEPSDGSAVAVPPSQNSLNQNSSPLQGQNFVVAKWIVEAEATTA